MTEPTKKPVTIQDLLDNPSLLGDVSNLQPKDPQDLTDWEGLGELVEEHPIVSEPTKKGEMR